MALLFGAAVWGVIVVVGENGGIALGVGGFLLALVNALIGYGVAASAKWLLRSAASAQQE
ncbi:MAG: hypothetical protein QGM46_09185 [Actinomycetota bacterium]|nr:hypothetical protein [Actinomycetota bacterium]MDK1019923.1 hypothetical protein [Actinomycetota bacterium]MDK1027461.1 hypothetical protein [Actinomycetota bacterium]MDK1038534.1 hypothetical protein [Actinomycetota bacterium]MDK1292495.1 hypothetical protein [Actinomycetota bacterium]